VVPRPVVLAARTEDDGPAPIGTGGERMIDPRTPVLIGVGQLNERGQDAPEPVDLLVEAARRAIADSGAKGAVAAISSVRVVKLLSWRYRNPAALVAERLGAAPRHTSYSTDGGHTPQAMLGKAALDIQAGRTDAVLVGGAESWRTRMAYRQRGERPPWTRQPDDVAPNEIEGLELDMINDIESERGVIRPIQVYPMFESALRFAAGRSIENHAAYIAALWADFSEIARANPHAVLPQAMTPEAIGTPGPANRLIGFPYTKLLNSNNNVNQAAAVLICSAERARSMGVGDDRMVFPHAASQATDTNYVSNRRDMSSSPAITAAGQALFDAAATGPDDLAHIDLYSCFPSAVQVAAAALGIGLERQLTVTGGMTFAGGPWNNYVSHSIATMTEVLRRDPGTLGLCTANGGLLTKHALGLYSTRPPGQPFRVLRPEVRAKSRSVVNAGATGRAVIESYTVMHDNDGKPETAIATALLPDGARTWRSTRRADLISLMVAEEVCGRQIMLLRNGEFDLV
jgi:acetyl-CoA C-acetyltransferase